MKKELTPEAKKRMEEMAKNYATHTVDSRVDIVLYAAYQEAYQAGYNDPDRQGLLENIKTLAEALTMSGNACGIAATFLEFHGRPSRQLKECVKLMNTHEKMAEDVLEKLKAARVGG